MTPLRPRARRALVLAALLAAPLGAQVDEQALAAAEQQLDEARAEREAAQLALEQIVFELEDDHEALTSGPVAVQNRQVLVLAMMDALPAARTRLQAEVARGVNVLRGSRRRILEESFAEPVQRATPVDDRLAAYLAGRVADELSRRPDLQSVTQDEVLAALQANLDVDQNWYQFWNDGFATQLEAAQRYVAAVEAYEKAGLERDRARHPERYGPRGEQAPPGMVIVPGGNYELGPSPSSGWPRERRRAYLRPFAMDRHEVTIAEYGLFVNSPRSTTARRALLPRGWSLVDDGTAVPPDGARPDHPVVYVSWSQAAEYAGWAGKRLPTENEWEAAAAGVEGRIYPWGDTFVLGYANMNNPNGGPLPVESFPQGRSSTGCHDLAGNVWEWTATLDDGTDFQTLPDGLVNVIIRGGSFRSQRSEVTTRHRWAAPGHDPFAYGKYDFPIGFRCVQDLR